VVAVEDEIDLTAPLPLPVTVSSAATQVDSDVDFMDLFASIPSTQCSQSQSMTAPVVPIDFMNSLLPHLTIAPKEPKAFPSSATRTMMHFYLQKTLSEVFEILSSYFQKTKDLRFERSFYQYVITSTGSEYCRIRLQIYTTDSEVNRPVFEARSNANLTMVNENDLLNGSEAQEHTITIEYEDGNRYLAQEIAQEMKDIFFVATATVAVAADDENDAVGLYGFSDYESFHMDLLSTQAERGFGFAF
jgi:hypothetical protein